MFGQNIFEDIFGLPFQFELVLRIVLSCLAGAIIGYERKKKEKVAGMRTHIIAAMASTLFCICSKYSYFDVTGFEGIQVDASRIAANIVTGICFLGAGMIFVKNHAIKGLTTAAGVWAVSGIGMCFGNGLYIVAFAATVIMIMMQYTLYNYMDNFEGRQAAECNVVIRDGDEHMEEFLDALKKDDPHIKVLGLTKSDDGSFTIRLGYHTGKLGVDTDVWKFVKEYPYVTSCNI
ncbi:MAG: MgtC/SapB family protein [Lachnospiraceae bacterium]|nr:MgtC/SapB family protein [Lachnospiraceae bacterium]